MVQENFLTLPLDQNQRNLESKGRSSKTEI